MLRGPSIQLTLSIITTIKISWSIHVCVCIYTYYTVYCVKSHESEYVSAFFYLTGASNGINCNQSAKFFNWWPVPKSSLWEVFSTLVLTTRVACMYMIMFGQIAQKDEMVEIGKVPIDRAGTWTNMRARLIFCSNTTMSFRQWLQCLLMLVTLIRPSIYITQRPSSIFVCILHAHMENSISKTYCM